MMKVRELMTSKAHTCRAQDSLATAARLLWEHDIGMLPVVDRDGRVGATITDRDICMAAYTQGGPLDDLRVAEAMSRDVATCRPDDELVVAIDRMVGRQVHRLPVVDAEGRPVGVVSLNDLAQASGQHAPLAHEALRALRAACRPRATVPVRIEAATLRTPSGCAAVRGA